MTDKLYTAEMPLGEEFDRATENFDPDWLAMRNAELHETNRLLISEIVDLRRKEKLLEHDAANFREIFRAADLGCVIGKLEGLLVDANDSFLRMIGHSRECLKKEKLRWEEIFHLGREILAMCRRHESYGPNHVQFIKKNGDLSSFIFMAYRMERKPTHFIGFAIMLSTPGSVERGSDFTLR